MLHIQNTAALVVDPTDLLRAHGFKLARQREQEETVYRVVDAESAKALEKLTDEQQEAARAAVDLIRSATQADEQEGQG